MDVTGSLYRLDSIGKSIYLYSGSRYAVTTVGTHVFLLKYDASGVPTELDNAGQPVTSGGWCCNQRVGNIIYVSIQNFVVDTTSLYTFNLATETWTALFTDAVLFDSTVFSSTFQMSVTAGGLVYIIGNITDPFSGVQNLAYYKFNSGLSSPFGLAIGGGSVSTFQAFPPYCDTTGRIYVPYNRYDNDGSKHAELVVIRPDDSLSAALPIADTSEGLTANFQPPILQGAHIQWPASIPVFPSLWFTEGLLISTLADTPALTQTTFTTTPFSTFYYQSNGPAVDQGAGVTRVYYTADPPDTLLYAEYNGSTWSSGHTFFNPNVDTSTPAIETTNAFGFSYQNGGVSWISPAAFNDGVFAFGALSSPNIDTYVLSAFVPPPDLTLACPLSGAVVIGLPYSGTLIPTGGTGPYTFGIISGSLPPGIGLNASTGVIAGTTIAVGTFPYTARVTDSVGATADASCELDVTAPDVCITAPTPTYTPTLQALNEPLELQGS